MSTASMSHRAAAPSSAPSGPSRWIRLAVALKAAWRRAPADAAVAREISVKTVIASRMTNVPASVKIAAISIRGLEANPVRTVTAREVANKSLKPSTGRVLRRPGVQGRWKASDRVGMP